MPTRAASRLARCRPEPLDAVSRHDSCSRSVFDAQSPNVRLSDRESPSDRLSDYPSFKGDTIVARESNNGDRSRGSNLDSSGVCSRTFGSLVAGATPGAPSAATAQTRRGGRSADRASRSVRDRKSTRLNSRHVKISYAVFFVKKTIDFLKHT